MVDDTCEVRIDVTLQLPGMPRRNLSAHANVFVGPPDFAPDRRPFLSLADELNDRTDSGSVRNAALDSTDVEAWVQDLFERVQETVSLMNLDFWRLARGVNPLSADGLLDKPLADDGALPAELAMGSRDKLRNPLGRSGPGNPGRAAAGHRACARTTSQLGRYQRAEGSRRRGPRPHENAGARGLRGGHWRGRQLNVDAHAAIHAPLERIAAHFVGLAIRPAHALDRPCNQAPTDRGRRRSRSSAAVAGRSRAPRGDSAADRLMTTVIETQHLSPMTHRFRSGAGEHLLVVPFSRVFDLSADDAATLDADRMRSVRSQPHARKQPPARLRSTRSSSRTRRASL